MFDFPQYLHSTYRFHDQFLPSLRTTNASNGPETRAFFAATKRACLQNSTLNLLTFLRNHGGLIRSALQRRAASLLLAFGVCRFWLCKDDGASKIG